MARNSTLLIAAVLLGIGACTEQTDTEPEVAHETESEETEHEGDEHEEDEECSAAQQQRVDAILALTADQAAGA
ncbi:MAG TPA: hypothetical protein VK034_17390, partial [Enhygromyxa sp.]|nr:hypothetical protein [Enhygromyxa sp.]